MKTRSELGVSFSLHRCSELGINKYAVLQGALEDLSFRRFRLMSYWNIHEQEQGVYNFDELDWQMDLIATYKGEVTLSVGKRQPRWPECHMPAWAVALPKKEWYGALHKYIEVVVNRYKNHPALVSWQLENEALLKEFGFCIDEDYNPKRLHAEYKQVKSLDPNHPIIMTLSDSWGVPIRKPVPDMYAMSLYRYTMNKHGTYTESNRPPLFYTLRAKLITLLRKRPVFIHELQAEPWLAKGLLDTPFEEQVEHMSPERLKQTIVYAVNTGLNPIDLWGLEWWYWLKENKQQSVYWLTVKDVQSLCLIKTV